MTIRTFLLDSAGALISTTIQIPARKAQEAEENPTRIQDPTLTFRE